MLRIIPSPRVGFSLASLLSLAVVCLAAPPAGRARAIELVKQAAAAFDRADLARVITLCRQATVADPSYPRSYTWLGAVYQRRGERDSACAAFGRAARLSPGGPDGERAKRGLRELGCDGAGAAAIQPRLLAHWNATVPQTSLAFSPDGGTLAAGGRDGTWRLWNAGSGELLQARPGDAFAATGVATSSSTSAVGSGSGLVRVIDLRDGRVRSTLEGRSAVQGLDMTDDGRGVAVARSDGTVQMLDAESGVTLRNYSTNSTSAFAAAFSPGDRLLAVSAGDEVQVFEANSGRLLRRWQGLRLPVSALAWSGDGTLLAGGLGPTIRIWNSSTGQMERDLRGHALGVTALAFSGNNLLASGGYDSQIRFWDAKTGAPRGAIAIPSTPLGGLAIAPGGKRLAAADGSGSIWIYGIP